MIQGYDWTIEDTYAAQNMCPYETVSAPEPHNTGLQASWQWVLH